MTNQNVKSSIARRLNVVFREFDLPMKADAATAMRQAEDNYQYMKHTFFWEKCQLAMDEVQILKDQEAIDSM